MNNGALIFRRAIDTALIVKAAILVWACFALICLSTPANAADQTHFILNEDFKSQYILSPIEYRLDPNYEVKSPQHLSNASGEWLTLEGAASFLFEDHLGWIRFPIQNQSSNTQWIIEVDWPRALFNSLDLFYKADSSDQYIKINKDLRHRFYTWQLDLAQFESGTIVLRGDAPERLALPVRIYRADRYSIESLYIIAAISFFISVIVSLGAFNLFIGLRTKDETHLWYSLGQFGLAWFFTFYYGLDVKFYPGVPKELILIGVWALAYGILIGLCFFILSYMNFRNQYPRLYPYIMSGVFSLFVIFGLFGHIDSKVVAYMYVIQVGSLLFFILSVALYAAIRGDRLALYFLLIWLSMSTFMNCFHAQMLGLIERTLFTNHSVLVAFSLEALLFSFALGERINSLIRDNYEATTSAKVKSDFLAQMSHEIRTPMNAIIGMSQLMSLTELQKKQQFYNDLVQSSAESLLCIINDILDFSKIEAGKLSLERIPFSLNELIQGVLGIFYSHVKRTEIPLYCYIHPLIPDQLEGDPSRLRQILINLIGNAFKFTSEGYILLSVSVDPMAAGQVKFSIRDSGCGISERAQRKLFSAFSQVDASTSRKYGGTGLGLAISKQLSALMGGTIGVDSKEGVGSCFYFTGDLLAKITDNDEATYPLHSSEGLYKFSESARTVVVWSRPELCDLLATYFIHYNIRVLRCDSRQQLSLFIKEQENKLIGVVIDQELQSIEQLNILGITPLEHIEDEEEDHALGSFKWILLSEDIEDKPLKEINRGLEMCRWGTINRFYDELVTNKAISREKRLHSYQTKRSGLNILVAEDIFTNQEVIKGFMNELGHAITLVDNGIHAVQTYQQHSDAYDLILMDCAMPEMDGFEATRNIRSFEKNKRKQPALIVALTAHAFSEHREQCMDAGMNDHLSKPITLKNLVNTLNRHFPE